MGEVPENIYNVWGEDAVLCTDDSHEGKTVWHHKSYHLPRRRDSLRIRLLMFRKSLLHDLRYLVRG